MTSKVKYFNIISINNTIMKSQQISENAIQQSEEAIFKLSKKYVLELEAIIVRLPHLLECGDLNDQLNDSLQYQRM